MRNNMKGKFSVLLFGITVLFSIEALSAGLDSAMNQSVAGMKTQGERIKVVSQNIANSSSTGTTPGAEPYRRQIIFFKNMPDKKTGDNVVQVQKITKDNKTPLGKKFDPSHPAANSEGYVLLPNVETSLENMDMKEAQRSYEANLGAVETTKRMINSTIDLLR